MKNDVYAVILAGGAGSRLWPLSRNLLPKQFIKVGREKSFFEKTVDRISEICGRGNILVVTNKEHAAGAGYSQVKGLNIVMEPEPKNTAPAIGIAILCALKLAQKKVPNAVPVLVVLPSDHIVSDMKAFLKTAKIAIKEAAGGKIITLGIVPKSPETGYGYIEIAKRAKRFNCEPAKVLRFIEKPGLEDARKFVSSGKYFWNSGIFIFRADIMLNEFKKHFPRGYKILRQIEKDAFDGANLNHRRLEEYFSKMPNISIDYAIMEKSGIIWNIPSKIGWNDVGSWRYFYEIMPKDFHGNSRVGDVISIHSENNLLYSDSRLISAIGINNLVVVETADAILVSDINRAQEVKKIVEKLKNARRREFNEHLTLERPWGSFRVLLDLPDYRVKKIKIKPGGKIQFRYHKSSLRHWLAVKGKGVMMLGKRKIRLYEGLSANIPPKVKYMVKNDSRKEMEIIEVQIGRYSAAGDVVRLER